MTMSSQEINKKLTQHNIGKTIFLFIISCFTSFILLEILLRLYNPFPFQIHHNRIKLETNRYYEFKNVKNLPGIDDVVYHKKNKLGFRGDYPPTDLADHLSIITVGGSTTECKYISEGKTWPDILAKMLKKNFCNFWLNNAGLNGHSSFGHILLIEDYLIELCPKVALFLIGVNDVGRDDLNKYDNESLSRQKTRPNILDILINMGDYSELISIINSFYRIYMAEKRNIAHQCINLPMQKKNYVEKTLEKHEIEWHEWNCLPSYRKRLRHIIKLCRDHLIEPVFITQPALFGPVVDDMTQVSLSDIKIENLNGKIKWLILEMYNDVVREVSSGDNVKIIDLARTMPKSSRYFYDYYHFNNVGAEKVATLIYEELYPFLALKFPQYKQAVAYPPVFSPKLEHPLNEARTQR